jgi:hypothetical protein
MKELSDISSPLEQEPAIQPGIYRSRIFGFLQQQASRLKNTVGQSWRQVKVSVQWTGEILFAPLRWLNRFTQNPDRQLSGLHLQQLPPTPIRPRVEVEQLLAEVAAAGYGEIQQLPAQDDWSVIDERDWDTGLLQAEQLALRGESTALTARKPVIRGLACVVADRSLVLIDQHNQVLDVLSPSQQLHLQQQIDPMSPAPMKFSTFEPELALNGATNLSLLPGASTARLPATAPPIKPSNPWQQAFHWLKFYRDYWHIDEPIEPSEELVVSTPGSIVPSASSQPLAKLPSATTDLTAPALRSRSVSAEKSPQLLPASDWDEADLVKTNNSSVVPTTQNKKNNQTVFKPEWIEAPADDLGYHRSLFARILEWLDRLMLAIENWLIWLYQRLVVTDQD